MYSHCSAFAYRWQHRVCRAFAIGDLHEALQYLHPQRAEGEAKGDYRDDDLVGIFGEDLILEAGCGEHE